MSQTVQHPMSAEWRKYDDEHKWHPHKIQSKTPWQWGREMADALDAMQARCDALERTADRALAELRGLS